MKGLSPWFLHARSSTAYILEPCMESWWWMIDKVVRKWHYFSELYSSSLQVPGRETSVLPTCSFEYFLTRRGEAAFGRGDATSLCPKPRCLARSAEKSFEQEGCAPFLRFITELSCIRQSSFQEPSLGMAREFNLIPFQRPEAEDQWFRITNVTVDPIFPSISIA